MLLGEIENFKEGQIKCGSVFKMVFYPHEGVKPKYHDQESRTKYFVILGCDSENVYVGVTLINSEINKKMARIISQYQHCINSEKYDFLNGKSRYIDCYNIKSISKLRIIKEASYIGYIEQDDLTQVCQLLRQSPVIDARTLQQFGL